jgi:methylated-DNA-protein-cysteine methyltransferase-like protein
MKEQSQFSKQVIKLIRKIPKGKVATYGQIAKLAGNPQGSRGVAWILHSCSKSHKLPWHRVLNSKGRISFPARTKHFVSQSVLLKKEKIEVSVDGSVSLEKVLWKPRSSKAVTETKRGSFRIFAVSTFDHL